MSRGKKKKWSGAKARAKKTRQSSETTSPKFLKEALKKLRERLKEEVAQTKTLLEISRILNSSLDAKTVRTRAMESVMRLLDCEAGSLYLIDEEKGELYFEVALGERAETLKEIRLKIGEGVAGWVAQTGESALIADTEKDPRWASKFDRKSKFRTKNMVTVPVKSKGKIIGVLQAINKKQGKVFDQDDLRLMQSLADQVAIALENAFLYQAQRQTFFQTAEALALAIEKRDIYTGGHTRRVRDFSVAIGEELGLDAEAMENLELSAILHDIGKIGIEDRILRKPGKLDDDEFAQMRSHPELGFEILSHIKSLEKVNPGTRYHHERPDGKGYPLKLTGEQIPQIARIIAVADTWDAMTSDRPYRKALDEAKALRELFENRGNQFAPEVVEAFFQAYRKNKIYTQHRSPGTPAPESALALLTSWQKPNKLEETEQKGG
jgi:HD-GYP domain-containing protein (c-di-GMP phosphodiesterase class II)